MAASQNPHISLRTFFSSSAAALAATAIPAFASSLGCDGELPVTEAADPALASIDTLVTKFLEENAVPGASLAIRRKGKVVCERGFGYSDVEKKETVKPEALFRIASVSKPITAVAVMRLAEQGKLKLDDKVLDRMTLKPFVSKGGEIDKRWASITIRQCLRHTGGWDRAKSYDPIGKAAEIAKTLDIPYPVGSDDVTRYMMGQPLDFDPGERDSRFVERILRVVASCRAQGQNVMDSLTRAVEPHRVPAKRMTLLPATP